MCHRTGIASNCSIWNYSEVKRWREFPSEQRHPHFSLSYLIRARWHEFESNMHFLGQVRRAVLFFKDQLKQCQRVSGTEKFILLHILNTYREAPKTTSPTLWTSMYRNTQCSRNREGTERTVAKANGNRIWYATE